MINKEKYMRAAIRLAESGRGRVHPNPLVGAMLVRNGRIIARGAHRRFGGPHAEINALRRAPGSGRGAVLFVTLEPCSTWGKTGPCVEAVIKAGIRKVYVGAIDPNPRHQGRGIRKLRSAGIAVEVGICEALVRAQNAGFFTAMKKGRPYVRLKMAQSLDGKIATVSGSSRWITSRPARAFVHRLRADSDAVLVGTNTVRLDNPHLSARSRKVRGRPARMVLDRMLRLEPRGNVFRRDGAPVYVITSKALISKARRRFLPHVSIIGVEPKNGQLPVQEVLEEIRRAGFNSILVEGGGELASSLIRHRVVDYVYWFIAPKFIGGREAKTSVEGPGVSNLRNVPTLKQQRVYTLGSDIIVEGKM